MPMPVTCAYVVEIMLHSVTNIQNGLDKSDLIQANHEMIFVTCKHGRFHRLLAILSSFSMSIVKETLKLLQATKFTDVCFHKVNEQSLKCDNTWAIVSHAFVLVLAVRI